MPAAHARRVGSGASNQHWTLERASGVRDTRSVFDNRTRVRSKSDVQARSYDGSPTWMWGGGFGWRPPKKGHSKGRGSTSSFAFKRRSSESIGVTDF